VDARGESALTTDAPTEQASFLHRRLTFRVELVIALLITALAIAAHIRFLVCARGLWRDEVNSVNMAAMPLSQTWDKLQYDTFPLAHNFLLKAWMTLGMGGSDLALRFSGLFVGIGLLATVWLCSHLMGVKAPIVSIALVGLNPILIRYGDSLRPYGLGAVLALVCFALMWRMIESPTWKRTAWAAAACVASAQSSFQNCTVIAGCCIAVGVVALIRLDWKLLIRGMAAGAVAALTMLPYWSRLRAAGDWTIVLALPPGNQALAKALADTFSGGERGMGWLWIFIGAIALLWAVWSIVRGWRKRHKTVVPQTNFHLAIYCLLSVSIAAASMSKLLLSGGFIIRPWHMLPLLALAALATDALIYDATGSDSTARGIRTTLGIVLSILVAAPAFAALGPAQSNMRQVAEVVEKNAVKGDLVVVAPWYLGVTFARYYHGPAEWITVPPMDDHSIHRYDLIKTMMLDPAPVDQARGNVYGTLRVGRRIWLVGPITSLQPDQIPRRTPVAPNSPWGWSSSTYMAVWEAQVAQTITQLSPQVQQIPIDQNVQPLENVPLLVVQIPGAR
jgi:hypothetical protein